MWPFPKSTETNENTLSFRDLMGQMIGKSNNGLRDIYPIYGYTRTRSYTDYFQYYRLNDYANRVIEALPKSCWRDGVEVKDQNNEDVLVNEIKILNKAGQMFKRLESADILNRIGDFSVLYVGVPDGEDSPLKPLGTSTSDKLNQVFFSAFSEDGVVITEYNKDILSPRFGKPEIYSLQKRSDQRTGDKIAQVTKPIQVHWSRIIHLAEGSLDDGIVGMSALSPILNRIKDLDKSIGGAAEAYFRNARGKLAFKVGKDFSGFKNDADKAAFDTAAAAFTNNWQDQINLVGMDITNIETPHADPKNTVLVALQAIAAQTGMSIRQLTGEGAGQFAGNEDKATWDQLVADRQNHDCECWMVNLFEILTKANMLEYKDTYVIEWPEIQALNEKDRSEVNSKNASAFKSVADALSTDALDGVVDVEEVYKEVLDLEIDVDTDDEDLSEEDEDVA